MLAGLSAFFNCKGNPFNPTPPLYTVIFDAQGGSAVAPLIVVGEGKPVTKPTDPVKPSFSFGGWYKEAACTTPWNFATDTVTANITLYAKWNAATVTVLFAVSGEHGTLTAKAGDTPLTSGTQIAKGTVVTFTAHPEVGYEVESWKSNGETKSGTGITVTADKDITVTVKFKATVTYTVSFDAQGGAPTPPLQQIGQGKTVSQPTDPARDSFTFGGWYKESECTTPWNFATDTVTANITLYAKWTAIPPTTFTVTFTVKDGNGSITAKAGDKTLTPGDTVNKGTAVTFTVTPAGGYEVDYLLINNEEKTGQDVTVTADRDITALVRFKPQSAPSTPLFTVTYSGAPNGGGSVTAKKDGKPFSSGGKVETGTILDFTAQPHTGYEVSAWTSATATAPDKTTATLTVTENSTVTVTFALKKYPVTFDAQGGAPTPDAQQIEHGKTVSQPTDPVKPPFTFGGWYKESECTTPWNFAADTVTAPITLYAYWKPTPITIHFDPSKMSCKKDGGGDINPGDKVYENDWLQFEAINLPAGQLVDKWKVNGVEKEYETNRPFHLIVMADDVQGGELKVDYTVKTAAHGTIQFEPSKMTCRKDDTPVNTGSTVYENDDLIFEAINLSAGQTVDKWKVNGVEKEHETQPWFRLSVRAADVQGGAIAIDYTVKTAAHGTIQFDPSKMKCWKNGGTTVNTGDTVYENDYLRFEATLSAGQTVNKWTVNGVENPYATGPVFGFRVRAEDAQGGAISIDYTVKQAAQVTIHFDPSKMTCKKDGGGDINPGDKVYENDWLNFEATPPLGQTVDKWTVNGVEPPYATDPWFGFRVRAEDAQSGALTIDYTQRPVAQATIRFDPSKMTCKKDGGTPLTVGETVYENDSLNFRATLSPGQTVDKWTVNGVEHPYATAPWFGFRVGAEDVQSGALTIDYTQRPVVQATIHFEPSKMTCKNDGGGDINPGDKVYENDLLYFDATLSAGQTVDKWTVNGVEDPYATGPGFVFRVGAEDVQSGALTIDYTQRPVAQATIHFDPSKMSCWKQDSGTPLTVGETVYENDSLVFIAQPNPGKMADSWMINDTPVPPQEAIGNRCWYRVKAQPSELRFDYTEKPAEKVELRFNASKIQCTKLFDQTPILPGPRDEGDLLLFTAKNGTAVLWKINGRLIPRPLKNCYVPFIKEILEEEFGNGHDVTVSYE